MSHDDLSERNVTIRPQALADIETCVDYLEEHASTETALRFHSAVVDAIERIAAAPGVGSPLHLMNPRMRGLRMRIVPGFKNYLLFYLTTARGVEIIRMAHGAKDVNTILESEV